MNVIEQYIDDTSPLHSTAADIAAKVVQKLDGTDDVTQIKNALLAMAIWIAGNCED